MCSYVFPVSPYVMRGLRDVYENINPFVDEVNPTVAEVDNWNLEVVRHFRRLFGITTPVSNDRCQYLRAQWSTERKNTTVWDSMYPTDGGIGGAGPCGSGSGSHCGFTFVPSCADQLPYLNGSDCCTYTGLAEGLAGVNIALPWFCKLGFVIAQYLCNEGRGGHTGPFFGREKMGISWLCGGGATFRGQWSGSLIDPCP
jgi:hypothetical protein